MEKHFEISGYSDGYSDGVRSCPYSKILALTASIKQPNDPEVEPRTSPALLYPPVILTYLEEAMCFVPGQRQPFPCSPESEILVIDFFKSLNLE